MDNRVDDDENDALSGMSAVPPPKKVHSYSHQLLPNPGNKRTHQLRNHSLDDFPIIAEVPLSDSSDDEFCPGASSGDRDKEEEEEDYLADQLELGENFQPLPEFLAAGGGTGTFNVPPRAAVHPSRPPCLELRPHPLRETQTGRFLRTLACTESQLWAGQENGVRFWNSEDMYECGCGTGGKVRRGDEEAAPFRESANTTPTTCLMVDSGNRLVWSGHKDGKIRSWKMDVPSATQDANAKAFKEGLSWQAHRGAVNSIITCSYGDIWSCSEGGVIKIWTWEAIEKSLSLNPEEKHMAALLVERSAIDLRSQVTVNGTCSLSTSEVKCLLADNVRAKVWAAQSQFFSLWDARTKELLKVFPIDGNTGNKVDIQDQPADEEVKIKSTSTSKKEKTPGFLQRSRNAIMGAADAVRRVATRGTGAFAEDNKRTETMVLAGDGMIWSGCSNGLLVQWDGNGNRLQDLTHHRSAVLCFCTFGGRIYVGYLSGYIQVIDLEGNLIAEWVAHNSAVIKMAAGNSCIFSLATHGGIRGWSIISPGPLDRIIRSKLSEKESTFARRDNIRILIGTWNVGQGRASQDSIMTWLGSVASDVGIVVVGLQEVGMGAGFLAMSAAKETVGVEGSSIGQWWTDTIGKALDEKTTFERMGSRQLAGLHIALWVRKSLRTHVGDVDVAAVACGFGRAIGNKGGVGLRIRVFDRIMCFVNCHLAAHLDAVNRRNADFDHIYRTMAFSRPSHLLNAAPAAVSTGHSSKNSNNTNKSNEEVRHDLADADMVMFFGDFNYRLFGISYDEARDLVSQRCFDWLREKDQLRAEMEAGKVFQGMREAIITFPPTYKFERGRPGLGGYDSGEKKRIPAWCDRVIFRDTRRGCERDCSLECPVVASVMLYEACMDVTESDHKPVRCKFHVKIAHADRSVRRQKFGEIIRSDEKIRSMLDELQFIPDTVLSTNSIALQNQDTSVLRIRNKSAKDRAIFRITCEGQTTVIGEDMEESKYHPRGSFGLPRWLEVSPAAGIIEPDSFVEVEVHHEEYRTLEELVDGVPQNWCSIDSRDKEAILVAKIQGSCSTETSSYRIHVRHCFSARAGNIDHKSQSVRKDNNQRGSQRCRSEPVSFSDKVNEQRDGRNKGGQQRDRRSRSNRE